MFESGVPRDEAGVGRARATNPDELPGDATSKHGSDPQHDGGEDAPHCPHRLDWGLAVPPTLPAWVPGEGVRVPMLPARSVLKCDVVSVNDLDPSRGLSYWVLTPMQPAHGAVVRLDRDLLSVQIAFKVFEGPGTSRMGGTLPRADRSVLRPRLK